MIEPDAETTRHIVKMVGDLLIARKDVKAVEHTKYGWMPDRERPPRGTRQADMPCLPFRMQDFREHLFEKRCLGTYLLDPSSRVKFFAIDLDLKTDNATMFPLPDLPSIEAAYKKFETDRSELPEAILDINHMYVGNLEEALHNENHVGYRWSRVILKQTIRIIQNQVNKQLGLQTLNVITGGGAHVLVPFGTLVAASEARTMANIVMAAVGWELFKGDCFWRPTGNSQFGIEAEVFPKQDHLAASSNFGNLIRLPLGWHTHAGVRTYFLDFRERDNEWELPKADSLKTLEAAVAAVGIG